MIWRLLRSLRVQLVLLIIIALGIAQFVSLWLFADERSLAIRAALGFEAAGRAANVARLIEEGLIRPGVGTLIVIQSLTAPDLDDVVLIFA